MDILNQLASAQNIRNTEPNKDLAARIAESDDEVAVSILVEQLGNKKIQSDCIKVLYEIGERKPMLLKAHAQEFIDLLSSRNNRMVWGAMAAIDCIALLSAELVYEHLPLLLDIAAKGSVITKDHLVNILVKLSTFPEYIASTKPLLFDQLRIALPNQFPKYAEQTFRFVGSADQQQFVDILQQKLREIEVPTKAARVEKLLKKANLTFKG